ncbi:MAG TPA: hypothetical protein VF062_26755 [Candidatus Limnocylindrales bacterium]
MLPVVEMSVDLTPDMRVHLEDCLGDLPFVAIDFNATRLILSLPADDASLLTDRHVALVGQFAAVFSDMHALLRNRLSRQS